MIKSRRIRLAGQVANMGENINALRNFVEKIKKNRKEQSVVGGKMILKWVLET
jgi:hypothetical protein